MLKKLSAVLLWCILAAGIYWCSASTKESGETNEPESAKAPEADETADEGNAADDEESALSDSIRVLIKTDDFGGIYHDELKVVCEEGLVACCGSNWVEYTPGEECIVNSESFRDAEDFLITLTGNNGAPLCIANLKRSADASYRGSLECRLTAEGIVVINELKVEEYLYGVVPSEMQSSYPHEALKAQAISARTYTYYHKKSYAYPEWSAHVDDSTAFQVYKNISETNEAITAVDETKNEVLTFGDEIIESFYYSTSGGFSGGARVWSDEESDMDAWLYETGDERFAQNDEEGEAAYQSFIDAGNPSDVEYKEAWYRWNYEKSLDGEGCRRLLERLYELAGQLPDKVKIRSQYLSKEKLLEETAIRDIRILKRQKSGLVTALLIETDNFMVSVRTQHVIRQALAAQGDIVVKNDGSAYSMGDLLASAYFYIEKVYDSDNNKENGDNLKEIIIHGAGLGHGCGMSQNGAKNLADRGFTAYEILAYYYNGAIKSAESLK
ncbi:MAG: SpoIID/LytB domain-containing protein [Lachnospiraceae bacterium]|nr:SpoIID/LytB domain-containing protein [Lachnospiraceae bacterium]